MTDAFNYWWNGEVEQAHNPYEPDTPVYWAWLGWMAGAAHEREACAQIVKSECIGFADDDQQLNRIAAAIRARGNT